MKYNIKIRKQFIYKTLLKNLFRCLSLNKNTVTISLNKLKYINKTNLLLNYFRVLVEFIHLNKKMIFIYTIKYILKAIICHFYTGIGRSFTIKRSICSIPRHQF